MDEGRYYGNRKKRNKDEKWNHTLHTVNNVLIGNATLDFNLKRNYTRQLLPVELASLLRYRLQERDGELTAKVHFIIHVLPPNNI